MTSAPIKLQKLICQHPYFSVAHNAIFPCNKCVLCRARRGRQWSHRLALEATDWSSVCHVTLTYAPRLSDNHDMEFHYEDVQLFMKRFRKFLDSIGYSKIKFFCAGERGEHCTQRVHYHILLFGIDKSFRDVITEKWRHGFIRLRQVESTRGMRKCAAYVSQYVLKKIGDRKDGLQHCSRGIGLKAAMRLFKKTFLAHYQEFGDFQPIVWQGETLRLDRYIKTKIAESLGILEELKTRWKEKAKEFLEEILTTYDIFGNRHVSTRPVYPRFELVGPYESEAIIDWNNMEDYLAFTDYSSYIREAVKFVGKAKFEAYEQLVVMRQKKNNRGFFANVTEKCYNVF